MIQVQKFCLVSQSNINSLLKRFSNTPPNTIHVSTPEKIPIGIPRKNIWSQWHLQGMHSLIGIKTPSSGGPNMPGLAFQLGLSI